MQIIAANYSIKNNSTLTLDSIASEIVTNVPLHKLMFETGDPIINARAAEQNATMAKATRMNVLRQVKAVYECAKWMLAEDGKTIVHREEAKQYPVGASGECVCLDMADYVRPIRRKMDRLFCKTEVFCKHYYIRLLLQEQGFHIDHYDTGAPVVAVKLFAPSEKPILTFYNPTVWQSLKNEAYRLPDPTKEKPCG